MLDFANLLVNFLVNFCYFFSNIAYFCFNIYLGVFLVSLHIDNVFALLSLCMVEPVPEIEAFAVQNKLVLEL